MKNFTNLLFSLLNENSEKNCIYVVQSKLPDFPITYKSLIKKSSWYANKYKKLGIKPGEVIILILQHGIDLIYAYFGAILNGSIPSILPFLTEKLLPDRYRNDLTALIAITKPTAIVTYGDFYEEVQSALSKDDSVREIILVEEQKGDSLPEISKMGGFFRDENEIALLQHSSGSTGLQKGIALSHKAVINQMESYEAILKLEPNKDVIVSWLPLYHDMGLIACFLMPILRNVPLVLLSPFDWVRAPYKLMESVTKYKGTLTWLPNFAYNFCAMKIRDRFLEDIDLSSWRAVINCSEPTRWESHNMFYERFKEFGLREEVLNTCYAMAENVFAVTQRPLNTKPTLDEIIRSVFQTEQKAIPSVEGETIRMLSAGKPIAGVKVKIINDKGDELTDRLIGQVAIKSNCMLSEYYNRPDETQNAFLGGWYLTGDYGYLVEDELFITGRKKDLIIVGGKNVYPQDIELLAMEISGIYPGRVVAFGLFNDTTGTEDVILIEETEKKDSKKKYKIKKKIRKAVTTGSAIALSHVLLVEKKWLIKTSSGKIARSANREKYITTFQNG